MEFLIFIVPVLAGVFAYLYYSDEANRLVFSLTIAAVPMFIGVVMFCIFKSSNGYSEEFHGGYVAKTSYYEPWNERVAVTKTRTVMINGKSRTQTYKVIEIRNHSEQFEYTDNLGKTHSTDEVTFDRINRIMGNPEKVFRDMDRNYYTEDGDAWDRPFSGRTEQMYPLTTSERYWNPVKANPYTILGYEAMEQEEADTLGLYNYPEIKWLQQQCVLGTGVRPSDDLAVQRFNAKHGSQKQIRLFILLFRNKGPEIAEQQKRFWYNGNKNELVVCLGMSGNTVKWCRGFSWCDRPVLEVKSRKWFIEHPQLDIPAYLDFLEKNLGSWERKEFKDFDYISVDLTGTQSFIFCLLIVLLTGLTWVFIDIHLKK